MMYLEGSFYQLIRVDWNVWKSTKILTSRSTLIIAEKTFLHQNKNNASIKIKVVLWCPPICYMLSRHVQLFIAEKAYKI